MDLAKPVQSLISSIGSVGSVGGNAASTPVSSFGDVLKNTINQTVDAQHKANELTMAAAQGQPVALQDVVQAVSQAELTLQTLVTVRDRAVEAYQQIMQMPV